MIRAQQEGRSEEELIAEMQANHEKDFAGFDIEVRRQVVHDGTTDGLVAKVIFAVNPELLAWALMIRLAFTVVS